jgi:hypothetical protein
MGWYGKKIDQLKKLSTSNLLLLIGVKFLAGVGVGVLLATWLPVWTWWIFIVIAVIIAIPLYTIILKK